jgi:N-acyl homoserine lactone hydrolase
MATGATLAELQSVILNLSMAQPHTPSLSESIVSVQISERVRVHAIRTGWVRVHPPHREYAGIQALSFPAILLHPGWTEPLPIWTWLIEHPEGMFLVDTGENAHVTDVDYFGEAGKADAWATRALLRFDIPPDEQLDAQLARLGKHPSDVDAVVLTHLHIDHTDGLKFFQQSEILVAKLEWQRPFGAPTTTFPAWLRPRFIQHDSATPLGDLSRKDNPFGAAHRIATGLYAVPTPGHTHGHQSVLLLENGVAYCFAGDAAFTDEQLLRNAVAGICVSPGEARQTYANVRSLAARMPLVFLPSHDPASALRLQTRQVLRTA